MSCTSRATLSAVAALPLLSMLACVETDSSKIRTADPTPVFELGALDGSDEQTFGWIHDLEVDGQGNLFLLDRQSRLLHAFDRTGSYLGLVAGPGEGPSELGEPSDLVRAPDGSVEVLDPRQGRVLRFEVRDRLPLWVANTRVTTFGSSFCWVGDRRVLLTPTPATPAMAELGADGSPVRTFGEPYVEELPPELDRAYQIPVLTSYNIGWITCRHDSPEIVTLLSQVPLVRAFDLEGDLLWEHPIEGFTRIRHQPGPEGGVVMVQDPGEAPPYYGAGVILLPHAVVLSVGAESSSPESHPFQAVVLSRSDGTELDRVRLPYAILAAHGDLAYGVQHHPYPKVVAFRWGEVFGQN